MTGGDARNMSTGRLRDNFAIIVCDDVDHVADVTFRGAEIAPDYGWCRTGHYTLLTPVFY